MNKNTQYYLNLPYTLELYFDPDHAWFIRVKELPGCTSQGETPDEAVEMVKDAMQLWIEDALESGESIPEPRPDESFSGKFNLRVPVSLHRKLVENADRDNVSLNAFCNTALAEAVGGTARTEQTQIPESQSKFDVIIENLCQSVDLDPSEDKDNEALIADWIQSIMAESKIAYQTGNVREALRSSFFIGELLRIHAKKSPFLQSLASFLVQLNEFIEQTATQPSPTMIYKALEIDEMIEKINQSTIQNLVSFSQVPAPHFADKKFSESPEVSEFSALISRKANQARK